MIRRNGHHPGRGRFLRFAMVVPVLAGTIAVSAPAASAPVDLTCSADGEGFFSPALRPNGTSATRTTASLAGCISPSGLFNRLHGASIKATGTAAAQEGLLNCPVVIEARSPNFQIDWHPTGEVSKGTLMFTTRPVSGDAVISGSITSGPLAGRGFTAAPVVVTVNGACPLLGLVRLSLYTGALAFG